VPTEAVFGLLYLPLSREYATLEELPVMQLPEAVRKQDPNLRYKPSHRLSSGDAAILVGPRTLTVSVRNSYPGWKELKNRFESLLAVMDATNVVQNHVRFGLRYINFFEEDLYGNINVSLTSDGISLITDKTVIRTVLAQGDLACVLNISNSASFQPVAPESEPPRTGSVLDLDVYTDLTGRRDVASLALLAETAHRFEKEVFFSLLSPTYLKSLNPVYD
jgi:uncharacterized protein (TIGR04255 family)